MQFRPTSNEIGKAAYEAYRNSVDGKSVAGTELPDWDNIGTPVQNGWKLAAEAVRHKVEAAQ
ncbi:hypothetical protein [Streptomyces sp. NPDC088707]|uniref:hypothetical protein n=1 Tax=Streptomyces sp. NPDC088707 TaxID=3365871 RepID=UPI0037FF43DF